MFPTTIWTLVHEAGAGGGAALEEVAAGYRAPVLAYVRAHRIDGSDAEDLCQEVFLRLLKGGVLAKADPSRGSFRALLRTVTRRVIQDAWRRRKTPVADAADVPAPEPDFDHAWVWHLTERALARLREESPRHHAVLRAHLDGEPQGRQRLWVARTKLRATLRREVALTCRSPAEIEEELAALARYL